MLLTRPSIWGKNLDFHTARHSGTQSLAWRAFRNKMCALLSPVSFCSIDLAPDEEYIRAVFGLSTTVSQTPDCLSTRYVNTRRSASRARNEIYTKTHRQTNLEGKTDVRRGFTHVHWKQSPFLWRSLGLLGKVNK